MIEYIQNDKNFYVTDEVSSVPTDESNTSWENRYKFVTDLAAISRGKYESCNPEARFKHLLKEASVNVSNKMLENKDFINRLAENKKLSFASRPLEFLPVIIKTETNCWIEFSKNISYDFNVLIMTGFFKHCYMKYDTKEQVFKIYTNFRNVFNWLCHNATNSIEEALELIPFNTKEELKDFKAIRVSSPMFVWSQLMTHTQISKESQSDRVSANNNYWLPEDIISRIEDINLNEIDDSEFKDFIYNMPRALNGSQIEGIKHKYLVNLFLNVLPQNKVQDLLKQLGYKREIYSRVPYYFKYKEMIMTGWMNDPEVWGHFLLEREAYPKYHKSWVQKETADVAKAIKKILLKG